MRIIYIYENYIHIYEFLGLNYVAMGRKHPSFNIQQGLRTTFPATLEKVILHTSPHEYKHVNTKTHTDFLSINMGFKLVIRNILFASLLT